jgi:hypothetical protein
MIADHQCDEASIDQRATDLKSMLARKFERFNGAVERKLRSDRILAAAEARGTPDFMMPLPGHREAIVRTAAELHENRLRCRACPDSAITPGGFCEQCLYVYTRKPRRRVFGGLIDTGDDGAGGTVFDGEGEERSKPRVINRPLSEVLDAIPATIKGEVIRYLLTKKRELVPKIELVNRIKEFQAITILKRLNRMIRCGELEEYRGKFGRDAPSVTLSALSREALGVVFEASDEARKARWVTRESSSVESLETFLPRRRTRPLGKPAVIDRSPVTPRIMGHTESCLCVLQERFRRRDPVPTARQLQELHGFASRSPVRDAFSLLYASDQYREHVAAGGSHWGMPRGRPRKTA